MNQRESLNYVLADLDFPAQRWEIVTQADMYGADSVTAGQLSRLPARDRPYHDLRDVLITLDGTLGERERRVPGA
ncbi:MAG TPA: DUF2795 domain-containing protein [Pseudonocardiaceae bacterium]|nr:DUF2795 domain-containing protein [Pseudonocardiaceae bacterium]